MSLMVLAENLASKGRNGDSVLVHMTPEEVRGLHALAAAHGGGLTINPETGLPEANFLKRLLPAIIGLAITATTGIPAWQVGLGVGAFETARTGDLGKGIMAGLGAYGGASFGASINTAGEAALASSASQAAFENVNPAVFDAGAAGTTADVAASAPISAQQAAAGAASTATPYDKFGAGVESLGTDQGQAAFMQSIGGAKGAFQKGYLAATPVMAGEAVEQKLPPTTTGYPDSAYITPYIVDKYGNLKRAGKYRPGEFPGFEQMYANQLASPPGAANGGLMKFADGGSVMMSPGMLDFVQRSEPVIRMADGGNPYIQMDGGGVGDFDATPAAPQFSNEQIYNVYQDLLKQGMTPEQIAAAAQRNPNIGLNAAQIGAAVSQFGGAPAVTPAVTAPVTAAVTAPAVTAPVNIPAPAEDLASIAPGVETAPAVGLGALAATPIPTPPAAGLAAIAEKVPGADKIAEDLGTGYGRKTISGTGTVSPVRAPVTDEQIFNVGKSLLQQGVSPQTILDKLASVTGATQEQINKAAGWLSSSGIAGLTTPTTTYKPPAVTATGTATTGTTTTGTTGAATTGTATETTKAPQTYGDQMVPGTNMTVREAWALLAKREPNVYRADNPILNRPINYFSKRAEDAAATDPKAADYLRLDAQMQDYADRGLFDPEGIAWLLRKPEDLNAPGALVAWQKSRPGYIDPANYKTFAEFEAAELAKIPSWSGSLGDPYSALSRIQRYYGFESPNDALQSVGVTPFADPAEQAKAIEDKRAQLKQYGSQYLDRFERAVSAWRQMTDAIAEEPLLANYGPAIGGSAELLGQKKPSTPSTSSTPSTPSTPSSPSAPVTPAVTPSRSTVTPYVPSIFTPGTSTIGGTTGTYTGGGGSTGLQNVGAIIPGQAVYPQGSVVNALQEYMKANPGASYEQVLAKAQQLKIPEPQLRAALNEYRFGSMTGGSKAAYDYLMGRGAYPTSPTRAEGAPISRSYAEAMGIPTTFQPVRLAGANTTTGATLTEDAPMEVPKVVSPQGTQYSDLVAFYFDANPDVKEAFEKEVKNMSPEDYVRYHWNTYGKKENRKGYYEKLAAEPATPADTVGGGASGGLTPFARGGLSALARAAEMGASRGGQFNLGDYSDGGRLLRGPGDGVSDSIPATIGGKRPARLADGEFVVPARIVSELGNGSTEAGARKLYAMMDRIQAARRKSVGKGKVAKNTRADKYLPA